MPIDREQLLNWNIPEVRHAYTERDTMLYALGLGVGDDPQSPQALRFAFERDLLALPTMAVVLGYPGLWMRDPALGLQWHRMLHGEQGMALYRPLPTAGTVIGRTRVTEVYDRGPEKGAVVHTRRDVVDAATDELLCSLFATSMLRADGGFGGPPPPARPGAALPERAPDCVRDLAILPQAAFIYRLSGDYNPLHVDPQLAADAGFQAPILHGLCTFGMAGRALLDAVCGNDPRRLQSMDVRFSTPVYPGETLRTEIWIEQGAAVFRSTALERGAAVLTNGNARLAA
ncbi:3-alpha,7-alpha,12-alpha-trihydroxy-5-beta-cholest-24-enoyl-CoA hydratase [Achromobacter sp. RTa]|uniref:MaoC/PaaZ C-terminal domain-containing protein n=1 Tax=Achromobacter sp. RTa TaxID=1532557 RepID=UPI0005102763|nr:MaoC/PaaZ C-terminal domain-containing protein [Achromobacter sp. RTa]KGD96043.1 3-alpha,7-alpha,12-alpha-trihydroxy-5-beta-cholest-24-enoyl-CoA hydratase [Achromobacter sp. RTa]